MESIKMKSNARKSTYSGKPSAANQEQLRMRQALKPESNANHVPVKSSSTTWKRSGWSLSARVRHGSKEELLTPMVMSHGRDIATSNCDVSSGSANAENVASSEKKSPDQRSLWSLFSTPKVQDNVDENKSQADSISNGSSRVHDEELTPHRVKKAPSRDPRIRKREESEAELTTKNSPPSFNLFSKMKPLKNASRNFFANLGKKPDVSVSQDAHATSEDDKVTSETQSNAQNATTEPHDSRLGNSTTGASRQKHFGGNKIEGAKKADNHDQNCTKTSANLEDNNMQSLIKTVSALSCDAESVSVNQKQSRDSPVAEDMMSETSVYVKEEARPSKEITMPTLTLPADIEHKCNTSDMSSELDESERLFIDEQALADGPSDIDEDSGKIQEEEEESHVLRVWSLQSEGETNSHFQNVDQSSSFSGDASSSLDDSLLLTGNESLNSLDRSKTDDNVRHGEKLTRDVNSSALSKSSGVKTLEANDAAQRSAESSVLMIRSFEKDPPMLQAQPNTHHLLQELDSLLECSTFQSNPHSSMQLESSEEMSGTNSLDHSRESDSGNVTEPARNIFSLFGGGKKSLSPKSIVKLVEPKPIEQSYRSALSKDSIVLSGSCSGERNRLTEHPEDTVNALLNNDSPDSELPTLSSNTCMLLDTPDIALSCNESPDTSLPTLLSIKSPDTYIPSLTPETGTGDGQGNEQNDILLRSSQPPDLCLEVNPSPSLGEKEISQPFPVSPIPEEHNVEDISFLAFETRNDLYSYSKTTKLKMQRKSSQTNRVPAKKCAYPVVKNVKMKKRKKNPIEAKIKALEQDLLWSMESRGLTEIVHPGLSRKGVALDKVRKNDLVVNVRNEELERISHKRSKHKKKHRSKSEVVPTSDVRWHGKRSNSLEVSRAKHGHSSSLHVRKSIEDKSHGMEHIRKPEPRPSTDIGLKHSTSADTVKVVGLEHGQFPGLQNNISKIQSSERSDAKTEIKKSKPKHSSKPQEWEICAEELPAVSERPSLKLKFISKAKTSPTKVEQSPYALSTKPRESTVPLKSPSSHIPVNVQQLHVPSASATTKTVVPVAPKPVEEKAQPSTRLPEEESLPFKPFEKPVASKKSAFVSDALEDLLQGVGINNKMKPLISPSTISVSNAKVVFRVPSKQSHSVKTLDMALKRLKPVNVSSPTYSSGKMGLGFKKSHHERDERKKKKKKKKNKHKDRTKQKIKEGFVFGTGPDDLVRKLPQLPFTCYGKTVARPLFARQHQVSNAFGEKSKGFLEVRNVLSLSGQATTKRQSDEVEVQSVTKIKQEPEERDEMPPPIDENLPPILNISLSSSGKDTIVSKEERIIECAESRSEGGQAPSETNEVKKCGEYCRLGCICGSLDNSRTVQDMSSHCRKVDCMFACVCKKISTPTVSGTRIRRPPTHACDMLFYDDSYKIFKFGNKESSTAEMKKLQLLDHLPACEKRNLVSTCARTRHFVTDKPEKWIKLKRKQEGDEADQPLEKKRPSESNVAHPLASVSPQNESQVSDKQQKSRRKQQFIPLSVPSDDRYENQVSNQESKVKNVPAQSTAPPSLAATSSQGNASTSPVMSTFIPVAKQYLLNGNVMNMVMLPNGNRILLPAESYPPYTVTKSVEQQKSSVNSTPRSLAPKGETAQPQTSTFALKSAKPTQNTPVESIVQHPVGLKLPVPKSGSSVSSVTSGFQKPVLPVRYQITSSGIAISPAPVAAEVPAATSNISQGTISLTSHTKPRILQASRTSEKSRFHTTVSQPVGLTAVSSTRTGPDIQHNQSRPTVSPQLNSTGVLTQPYVLVNPPVAGKACVSIVTPSKQNAVDPKTAPIGATKSDVNMQKKCNVKKLKAQANSASQEDEEEFHSIPSNEFLGDSEAGQMRIIKTFFMDLGDERTYIMLSTDVNFEWTSILEKKVKRAIAMFFHLNRPKGSVQVLQDIQIQLLAKSKNVMRLSLTRYGPTERIDQVRADVSEPTGSNKENVKGDDQLCETKAHQSSQVHSRHTDTPNTSEGGNLKPKASIIGQTGSIATTTTEDKIQINDKSSNISKDAVASHASNQLVLGITPTKTHMSPGTSQPNSAKTKTTSNTLDKATSSSDSTSETSTKLSSSLPEFDKLSEIVKRTSVDDDELSPIKKITKNASEWLQDSKIQKPYDFQSYSGVRGPWFTKEKEGVRVVLQRDRMKRSPFRKGGKSPLKPMQKETSKRLPTSSSSVISSRKSSKCVETNMQNTKGDDSNSCEGQSWAEDESDSEDQCHLSESSGLFIDSNANDSESTQRDDKCEDEASEPLVDTSKNSAKNEKTVIDGKREQQDTGIDSAGSNPPKAKTPKTDAIYEDGMEAEKEIGIQDIEGTLGIEHFARYSEEDDYGPLNFDEDMPASFDSPTGYEDDSCSIASLEIDEGIRNDVTNVDVGKSKSSSPEDLVNECPESPDVKKDTQQNLPLPAGSDLDAPTGERVLSRASSLSHLEDEVFLDLTNPSQKASLIPRAETNRSLLLQDIIQTDTTPVKDSDNLPKKSPMLNIKFVATSNENCTSPVCISPLSEVLSENTQGSSPAPLKSNDPSEAGLSDLEDEVFSDLTNPSQEASLISRAVTNQSPLPKDIIQTDTTPVKDSDNLPKKSPMLNIEYVATSNENYTSPVCISPLSEVLSENTQGTSPASPKSNDLSEVGLSHLEDEVFSDLTNSQKASQIPRAETKQSPLPKDIIQTETTPVKDSDIHPKKSPMLNIEFVTTSNENCTSPVCTSPLSEVLSENTQGTSPAPPKSNDSSEAGMSHFEDEVFSDLTNPSQKASQIPRAETNQSPLPKDIIQTETTPVRDSDIHPKKSPMLNIKFVTTSNENCTSPVCISPLSEVLSENTQGTSPAPPKSNDSSEAGMSHLEDEVFSDLTNPSQKASQIPRAETNQSPLPKDVIPAETTPVKDSDIHPKKSPMLNIKFVTTSNENCTSPVCISPLSEVLSENTQGISPAPPNDLSEADLSDTEIDVVNTDDDDEEIDVETVSGATHTVQNLDPYSFLRNITSRLSSSLQKELRADLPKKSKHRSSNPSSSVKLSIGQSMGSPRKLKLKLSGPSSVKLSIGQNMGSAKKLKPKLSGPSSVKLSIGQNMGDPRKLKPHLFGPLSWRKNMQSSSSTHHVKSKKKKSKRKSPVCPAKQWDSPLFQVVYKDSSAGEDSSGTKESKRDSNTHNILERRRREELRKAFIELSNIVHGTSDRRPPAKIRILEMATQAISELRDEERELLKVEEQFKKEQRRLVYVHSNLLHHARCNGQIVFPEGSKLAESMERIRSGLVRRLSTTSPRSEDVKDSWTILQGKGRKRKAENKEMVQDSLLTKKEPSTSTVGGSYGMVTKKMKEGSSSSHSEKKKSSSTKKKPFTPYPMSKDVKGIKVKGGRKFPVTKKEMTTHLRYGDSAGVETSLNTVLKGNQGTSESALDLSMPSGSGGYSQSKYGAYLVRDDDSSNDEESLPIDCYVSSSDEPEEEDEMDFGMDDDEQYSDDGFIPESEDESNANLNDRKGAIGDNGDENKGVNSDQEIVTINIDLDDFEQGTVESRSDTQSNAQIEGRKRAMPKVKQVSQRKEESSLESADSEDDVLVISEETFDTDDTLEKKQKERGKLGSRDGRTVGERNEYKNQSEAMNISRKETVTQKVQPIPSVSKTTPNSKTNQDSPCSTKLINPTEKGTAVQQDKAPLLDVIDEIMNRLKGDAQPSPLSSVEEEKTDEAMGPGSVGLDMSDSSLDDEDEGKEKLTTPSLTSAVRATGSIQHTDGKHSAITLKHKGDILPSKGQRTPGGGVKPTIATSEDSDSSSDDEMDGQERTSVSAAVGDASSSVKHKERNVSPISLKQKEGIQATGVMLDSSDSNSDDEEDGQERSTAPTADSSNSIHHKKEKSSEVSLKKRTETLLGKGLRKFDGVRWDDSDSSSSSSLEEQGELENLLSTSYTKDTGSVSNNMVEEKNPVPSSQKKTGLLPMKGALADLISSVKTRVENDNASDSSDVSESEGEAVSEDEDSDDDSHDEESSDDEEEEVEGTKEDIVAEDNRTSNDSGNRKQDITDMDKDVAGPSYTSGEKDQRVEKPENDSDVAGSSNSAVRNEEGREKLDSKCDDEAVTDPSYLAEGKGEETEKLDNSSSGDDLSSPPFSGKNFDEEREVQDGFSVGEDITDDDAACLSYAAMGNDEDNEALFDAENPTSPFSPISLDMNIASDDDIDDSVDDLGDVPQSSSHQLPRAAAVAGTSTDETKPRETSIQAEQSPGGHQKPSASSKPELTLDGVISFLNVEKNSDGTLNVFLKGDYDDEKLDELFEKPEVMDYIMSAAAKKPAAD